LALLSTSSSEIVNQSLTLLTLDFHIVKQ